MSFLSWPRNGNHSASASRRRTSTSARQRARIRPRLDGLEDRSLPSGLPYPTAATVSQLIADINDADQTGGAFTINLNPDTTFDLASANNTTDGSNGLPVVGGTKAVDLTILGNGGTIERVGSVEFRLFDVTPGSSLTLDHVTLRGGRVGGSPYSQSAAGFGGAIYNRGTLTVSDSTVSGNEAYGVPGFIRGGGIYNAGGTVMLSNTTLPGNSADGGYGGGIYNAGGTVTLSNSTFSGNHVSPSYTGGGGYGGGIYNDPDGRVTVQSSSSITGNYTNWFDQGPRNDDVHNYGVLYLDNTSTIGTLYGNPAIRFDPNAPKLQIRDVTVTEGNTGTVAAAFTVTLSAASTETVTVAYATADQIATSGSDYQAARGTLTFAPGETSKTITVLVNGDRVAEPNETFSVNLTGATNATIADPQGVGTLRDDEPRISISDVMKTEGKKGQTTYFTFTVTLSAASDQAVTMSFKTVNGTATTGNRDYSKKSGTLTFAPGETTKTITIAVKGDSRREANEKFYLDLFGPSSNALLTKNRGVGTILNDD